MKKGNLNVFLLFLTLLLFVNSGRTQKLFTEVSSEIGVDYKYPGTDLQMAGAGLVVIDVNNDGWEDFYQCGGVFDSKLWLNKKGKFQDASKEYGFETLNGYFVQGALAFDFDNDGFDDLFIANYGVGMERGDKKKSVMMSNQKGKGFVKMEIDSLPIGDYTSATACDVNKDGFTDLYITNYVITMGEKEIDSLSGIIGYDGICLENRLLINVNGERFVERGKSYGVDDIGCGLAAHFSDIDGDGDQDLMLANDFGTWTNLGNKYFRNDFPVPHFTDLSDSVGFNQKMYAMCIGAVDYDQDADLDYYVTNIGQNYFLHYDGKKFVDDAKQTKLDLTYVKDSTRGTSWSSLFFDYEFDGDLDFYLSKGNVLALTPKTAFKDPNKFFINKNGKFVDVTDSSGVNCVLSHRGAAFLDYDHDGDIDVVSNVVKLPWASFAKLEQKIKIYRNDVQPMNHVKIKLIGVDGVNSNCFGTTIVSEQQGKKMIQEVDCGIRHASKSTRFLYVGIGEEKKLDRLTIHWTNGTQTIVENLNPLLDYTIYSNGKIMTSKKK